MGKCPLLQGLESYRTDRESRYFNNATHPGVLLEPTCEEGRKEEEEMPVPPQCVDLSRVA